VLRTWSSGFLLFYLRTADFCQILAPGATSEVCKHLRSHEKYCGRRKNLLQQHQYQECEPVAVAPGVNFEMATGLRSFGSWAPVVFGVRMWLQVFCVSVGCWIRVLPSAHKQV
jgi:hypothetical protein